MRMIDLELQTDSVAENLVANALKKYNECRIAVAKRKFYERGQSMNLPKGSYLTPILNEKYAQALQTRQFSNRSLL